MESEPLWRFLCRTCGIKKGIPGENGNEKEKLIGIPRLDKSIDILSGIKIPQQALTTRPSIRRKNINNIVVSYY